MGEIDQGKVEHVVKQDGLPDLVFDGRLLAEVKSPRLRLNGEVVLKLFETSGEQYVCQRVTHDGLDGSKYTAKDLPNEAELVRHLADRQGALGHLEKALLRKAGLGNLPAVSEKVN